MKSTLRFKASVNNGKITIPKASGISNDKVDGTINGLPFLKHPIKNGTFKLTNLMQKLAGDIATVEILRVGEEDEIRVPKGLTKALKASPKAQKTWDSTTPIARRDWVFWISSGKQEETYDKRIATAISKLSSGMRRVCCFPGIKWLMEKSGK